MKTVRLVLADDHALVRAGIRSLLESFAGVAVVGEAGDGPEALELVTTLHPDVALVDISMPGLNGLDVASRISESGLSTRAIILSMHADDQFVHRAFRAGAAGYLLKSSNGVELELAVRTVASGKEWLSPALSKRVIAAYTEVDRLDPVSVLTTRQREILQLIAEGHSTRDIAARLNVSVKTVETHRSQLMDRLGIYTVAGLVRFALKSGIVRDE